MAYRKSTFVQYGWWNIEVCISDQRVSWQDATSSGSKISSSTWESENIKICMGKLQKTKKSYITTYNLMWIPGEKQKLHIKSKKNADHLPQPSPVIQPDHLRSFRRVISCLQWLMLKGVITIYTFCVRFLFWQIYYLLTSWSLMKI